MSQLIMKVLIGTNNKGKVEGARQAFEKFYENV
jgi:non-canonical (house-cleaning) NTP pyrophosphatase